MLPDNFDTIDINRLPYFVTNAQTGQRQEVYFAPLLAEDEAELRGADWSRAVYRDAWIAYAGDPQTVKLVFAEEPAGPILGLLHLGSVLEAGGFLRKSLLEAAPSCRTGTGGRKFAGVGRALVARLVAESLQKGGQGKVRVIPRPGSEMFYAKLGFLKGKLKGVQLESGDAAVLLASALWERQGESNGE